MKRGEAIAMAKDWLRIESIRCCYVYQHLRGHWECATAGSPVGCSLAQTTGTVIYPAINAKARKCLVVKRDGQGGHTVEDIRAIAHRNFDAMEAMLA